MKGTGLIQRAISRLSRKSAAKNSATLADPPQWFLDHLYGGTFDGIDVRVTPASAVKVSAVFACLGVIGKSFAQLPIKLFQRKGERRDEIVDDHRARFFRMSPDGSISAWDLKMAWAVNIALRNNAFGQILRNAVRSPVAVIPIEPKNITDIRRDYGRGARLQYQVSDLHEPVDELDMLHFRYVTFDGVMGADLVDAARDAVAMAKAIQDSGTRFFAKGQSPGMTLTTDQRLNQKQVGELRDQIESRHGGAQNFWELLVLHSGLKSANMRMNNTDSQFIETKKELSREIAQFFGVPPHKIGVESNIPRANAEQQALEFVTDTISPIATCIENTLNLRLLTPLEIERGMYFKVMLQGLLRGDMKTRMESYALGRQWGWWSVNEIRAMEDMNPIPNGDIYLEPHNMKEAGTEAANLNE